MGLDTSHNAWHASYSTFGEYRILVCEAAGVEMVPDTSGLHGRDVPIWWTAAFPADTDYLGNWQTPPADPLQYLVNHSDCDGVIRHEHLAPLIARLEQLTVDHWAHDQFLAGLRAADACGEDLEFG